MWRAASIRIVNRHNLSREDLLRSGTATEKMLDWLFRIFALWDLHLRGWRHLLR